MMSDARGFFSRLENVSVASVFWRALSFFATSLYFSFIPVFLFLIYMHENSFFSYDFFDRGIFGLKAFFGFIAVFLVLLSFVLYGFVIPIFKYFLKGELPWRVGENIDYVSILSLPFC